MLLHVLWLLSGLAVININHVIAGQISYVMLVYVVRSS